MKRLIPKIERLYDRISNFLFGGEKLTPPEM